MGVKMKAGPVSLGVMAASLPLAMGADAIHIPNDIPWYWALLASVAGPACVGLVYGAGRSIILAISGYFKAKADLKEKLGKEKLSDADKANDEEGKKLILEAGSLRGAAAGLDKAADKLDK
jgi:hypothetical protein